jgi:hypothetical protein
LQKSRGGDQSPLTIPMSFFSGGSDNRSDASGTPMASLAGSSASSFFMKMGKSVFTGRQSMQSDAGRSDVGRGLEQRHFEADQKASVPQYQYNFRSTDGGDSEVEVSRISSELNAANIAMLLNQSSSAQMKEAISKLEPSQPPRPHSAPVLKPPPLNAGSHPTRNIPPQQPANASRTMPPQQREPANVPRNMPSQQRVPANAPASRNSKRSVPNDNFRFDNDSPEEVRPKRSRIVDLESDDESEFSLNEFEGFEVPGSGMLGASAPSSVPSEYTSSTFGNRSAPQRIENRSGTLGASAPSEYTSSTFGNSEYTSSTFGNRSAPQRLGNRPTNMSHGQINSYNAKPSQFSRPAQQPSFTLGAQRQHKHKEQAALSGTFDVFAPSGPIGIVVDTSKHGPAVHSLKATSPMLGLISPGDLIISLDDEDTRTMTAASLTRLMAKKSRQKERKITLLSPEDL